MSENEENKVPLEESGQNKKTSALENYRRIKEQERKDELRREGEERAKRADEERKEREAYAAKLNRERMELLMAKQGLVQEAPQEKPPEKQYTAKEKIANFFYHYKIPVIVCTVVAALLVYLIYDIATKTTPDVTIMIIAEDNYFKDTESELARFFERYCEDYNGDGKVEVAVMYTPAVVSDEAYNAYRIQEIQVNQTRLVAEFQSDAVVLMIADKASCEVLEITDGVFADLSDVYPGDENVSGFEYRLSGTNFAKDIGHEEMSGELFAAFRIPQGSGMAMNENRFRKNYESATALWTNYISGNIVNPEQ